MQVVETERLILRWFTSDDAAFIFDLLNQPSWKRYIGDREIDSLEAARGYIERVLRTSYRQHGFGLYAVELKAEHTLAGMCGLIKRDGLGDVDIGFAFLPRFEGQGLAYAAASAVLSHSAATLGLTRIVAIASVDNQRSMRLMERLGMHYEGLIRLPGDDEPLKLYAMALQPSESKPHRQP